MTNKSRPSLCRLERVAIYHYASVCSMNGTILLTGVTVGARVQVSNKGRLVPWNDQS